MGRAAPRTRARIEEELSHSVPKLDFWETFQTESRVKTRICVFRPASMSTPYPLWVKSGHRALKLRCPLYLQKRTLQDASWMSADR
jgi:hypothetical protein